MCKTSSQYAIQEFCFTLSEVLQFMLLFVIVCSKYQDVPMTFEKPDILFSIDFPKLPVKHFCLLLDLTVPQNLIVI